MRLLMSAVLAIGVVGLATAQDKKDDKIDAKKLIGKWKPKSDDAPVVIEFKDKGKLVLSVTIGDNSQTIEGSYKLDGNKLEIAMSFMGQEMKETITIKKLDDKEMVGTDSKGKEETLLRVTEKDKK